MDFSLNSLATRYPRPRTTGGTAAAPTAHGASARTTLVLALGAYGLIDVVEDLGAPWAWLVQTLVLALLAVGFFVAAQRSHDHRVGWLLSSSVAAGLAVAAFYSLVDSAATPALPVAGLLVGIAIVLFVAHGVSRGRPRRARPPAASSIYETFPAEVQQRG
jgi:xanthosine utilization system XapX-like protein